MRNRVIVVPKTEEAEKALDFDMAEDHQLSIVQIDNDQFYQLWDIGLFSNINHLVGVLIDDYENEKITNKNDIERIVIFLNNLAIPTGLATIIDEIKDVFIEAIKRNRGVYFFF